MARYCTLGFGLHLCCRAPACDLRLGWPDLHGTANRQIISRMETNPLVVDLSTTPRLPELCFGHSRMAMQAFIAYYTVRYGRIQCPVARLAGSRRHPSAARFLGC